MKRLTNTVCLSLLGTCAYVQPVTIDITNETAKPVVVSLYEAVEEQSLIGEPELEAESKEINGGQTGQIEIALGKGIYELDALDKGADVLKAKPRSLRIMVGDDERAVLHVKVTATGITYTRAKGCKVSYQKTTRR